jgi:hypothetical protein
MWTWIMIAALYAVGMGFLALLGGTGSAGAALRRWGESASRHDECSPLSC